MNEDVLAAAAEALKRGDTVALVTVVRSSGSTPQRAGAKMLVFADGRIVGLNSFLDTPALFPLFGLPLTLEPAEAPSGGDGR